MGRGDCLILWPKGRGCFIFGEGYLLEGGGSPIQAMLYAHFQPQTDSPGNCCFMVCPGIVSSCKEAFVLDILGKCYSDIA